MTITLIDMGSVWWTEYYSQPDDPAGAISAVIDSVESTPGPVVVCCDRGPYWRHAILPEYKSGRTKPPGSAEALAECEKQLEQRANAVCYAQGMEADDIIATLCGQTDEKVVIVSKDKDLAALVSDRVTLKWGKRSEGPIDIRDRLGVMPDKIRDLLALGGDSSDSIPGVRGIGPKTAAALIGAHGGALKVHAAAHTHPAQMQQMPGVGPSTITALKIGLENLNLSWKLAELKIDAPVSLEETLARAW